MNEINVFRLSKSPNKSYTFSCCEFQSYIPHQFRHSFSLAEAKSLFLLRNCIYMEKVSLFGLGKTGCVPASISGTSCYIHRKRLRSGFKLAERHVTSTGNTAVQISSSIGGAGLCIVLNPIILETTIWGGSTFLLHISYVLLSESSFSSQTTTTDASATAFSDHIY